MVKTVTVTALRPFTHDGRRYRRNDLVTVSALDAAILARRQDVTLSEQPVRQPVKRSRRYRRRDLVAESE